MIYKDYVLGLELGSTRIKAVVIDKNHNPVASGSYEWENSLIDGIWTYSMEDARRGIRECYKDLKKNLPEAPEGFGAIGISGMMHGYLPFDENFNQLAEFRTWRNTITAKAAEKLSDAFDFAVPQRWSIAHFYQAILNGEEHVDRVAHLMTLSVYIHYLLTGENVIGIGEASGMFPIDSEKLGYNGKMVEAFDEMSGLDKNIRDLLPKVLVAGQNGGYLTEEGAKLLDPDGDLKAGIPLCPPEGDAGTGMTATNSVRVHTGNVSAGTSDFAMLVADHELGVHREINMVTTPAGRPVAMVHCANCTTDINAWVGVFEEFAKTVGAKVDRGEIFAALFKKALEGQSDCGGLLSYNYYSGEGVTQMDEGRPIFIRRPDSNFTLANFMRMHMLSTLATLKIGLDILVNDEKVPVEKLYGHGGFFKTPEVGQRMLSAAVNAPVSVMETAGEGGPYGMALLAAFMLWKDSAETLEDYLDSKVFASAKSSTIMASEDDVNGFNKFLERYIKAFPLERESVNLI